jgi:predicted Zn-dependent protease
VPLEIADEYQDSAFARAQTGLVFNLPAPPPEREQLVPGISLCMIVKNEERFLAECLESVRDCVDEINIVDTGSTDATIEIARRYGANVIERPWRNDFSWARNESLAMATRRWTLVLDADEEIAREAVPLLRALGSAPADLTAVYVQIRNLVDDESGAGSTMTHILPRIFPNTPRIRYRNVIHENLALDGSIWVVPSVLSPILVIHKGYTAEMMAGRKKSERNQPLLDRAVREAGEDIFSWFNFGSAAIAAGNHEAGIEALERVFAENGPTRAFFPIAYMLLASAYGEARGDLARGLETIERGLTVVPAHPNLLFTRAHLLSLSERFDEARVEYQAAIDAGRDADRHYMVDDEIAAWKAAFNLGCTFVKQGRDADGVVWFERALAAKPASSMLRIATARAYERLGRAYDAERLFRAHAERGDVVEYVNFLLRRRRFGDAFAALDADRANIDDAAYAKLCMSAAQCVQTERLGDPEPHALRALAVAPGCGETLRFLDELYAARGESDKRDRLRQAELEAPLVAAADHARRSHRLLEEGRTLDALAVAEAGLAAVPDTPVLRYNAALAAARLGRDADARAHLGAVPADDRHATAALALRAEIEQRAGDLDAALAALSSAAVLTAPDPALLRSAGAALATALVEAGRLSEAGRLADLILS